MNQKPMNPDPATHPAIHRERAKMLEQRRQELLASKATFKFHDRVQFTGRPMSQPPLDVKRDLPEPAYRPGAFDHKAIPSRGW